MSHTTTNLGSGSDSLGNLYLLSDSGELSVVQHGGHGGSHKSGGGSSPPPPPPPPPPSTPVPTLVGAAGGFEINLVWDSSVASAPSAFVTAITNAAKYYTTLYSNPEVINLAVGYGEIDGQSMGTGALGESMSSGYLLPYSTVATDLKNGAGASTYAGDVNYVAQAMAGLPGADPTSGGSFYTSMAEAKALGVIPGGAPSSTSLDGYIGITSAYPLEYNQTASSGTYDATGIAEHEISEIMGRVGSEGQLFGSGVYTPLDLFRYSGVNVRDLAPGSGYFSIDGGATNLGTYNNPLAGGDASDWISSHIGDSYGFGYSGHTAVVSPTDILENAVLGYHLTQAGATATQNLGLA